ncbi:unnamed protein product [Owenia fusiformis]|uniref:EB domain-containing protein n=1 Tax=Owenia fusiformis TaxID=6347 RepID=A0A8J1TXX2_OWEFU|nr:unnamed protein product [Owenia fusiformis]
MKGIIIICFLTLATSLAKARKCDNHGDCRSEWYCEDEKSGNGRCVKTIKPPGACNRSAQCIGGSQCENGTCSERCRADPDCIIYREGRQKYCTTGGLVALVKGYCMPKKEKRESCSRSHECRKNLFCSNSICKAAEEAVACRIECVGPKPGDPRIKPGNMINVTYSCTFVRRGEFGPLPMRAVLTLNRKLFVGSVNGTSPLTFNGSVSQIARKGEFTAEIIGRMKRCRGDKNHCRSAKMCIHNIGQ